MLEEPITKEEPLKISKLSTLNTSEHGTSYLMPLKPDLFYRRNDDEKSLIGLFLFDSRAKKLIDVHKGYIGSYVFDKERGVIVGNDKKYNLMIFGQKNNLLFKISCSSDPDHVLIDSVTEAGYFSWISILKKMYAFYGRDGTCIILGRRSKKVLLRSKP
jgi:hypothetical protein